VAVSALTAQLPSLAGSLPDLFRRNDSGAVRGDDATADARRTDDASTADDSRMLHARPHDDNTRPLTRRTVLGPLTYGRRMASAELPAAAPVGLRGANLDVRG
jgi:hypothetical protein